MVKKYNKLSVAYFTHITDKKSPGSAEKTSPDSAHPRHRRIQQITGEKIHSVLPFTFEKIGHSVLSLTGRANTR